MKINVILLGLGCRGEIREVNTLQDKYSKESNLLCDVFQYGQNEFQSQPMRSVSVGDVIIVNDSYYKIRSFKFDKMNQEEFEDYKEQTIKDEIERDNMD